MATFTINGTLKTNGGVAIPGKVVQLRDYASGFPYAVRDSDETDAGGNYTVSTTISGSLRSAFSGSSPHYAATEGPNHNWSGVSNETHTDNLVSTFTNNNPTRATIGDQEYVEDTGNQHIDAAMSDADSGDVLTPVKLSGPSWGTIGKST